MIGPAASQGSMTTRKPTSGNRLANGSAPGLSKSLSQKPVQRPLGNPAFASITMAYTTLFRSGLIEREKKLSPMRSLLAKKSGREARSANSHVEEVSFSFDEGCASGRDGNRGFVT